MVPPFQWNLALNNSSCHKVWLWAHFVVLLTRPSCSVRATAYLSKSWRRFFKTNVVKSYNTNFKIPKSRFTEFLKCHFVCLRIEYDFSSTLSAQNASKSKINCLLIKSVRFQHVCSTCCKFQFVLMDFVPKTEGANNN